MSEKTFEEKTFSEILAEGADENKASLATATLQAFKEGDPSAIKLVMNALMEHKYNEENKFLIPDERFKEIIELAAGAIQRGEI